MARKRESRRHSITGFSERRRLDEMTNVRSCIILQSGEGLTFSNINNPVIFSCEKKKHNEVFRFFFKRL